MNIDWLELFYLHGLVILGELIAIVALLDMLSRRRAPTSMIAWLLAIVLLPYLAVPLYFVLGSRKRQPKYKKRAFELQKTDKAVAQTNPVDGILRSNGIPGTTGHNSVQLIFSATEAYAALMKQIASARESIWISTYVFKRDSMTQSILDALSTQAERGVDVRLLIDALGSWQLYFRPSALRRLRAAGGDVRFFMPILRMPFRNYINLRNHRKIYLFDQHTVLTGGMNLSNKYMGPDDGSKRWEDLLFQAEGASVFHYADVFASDWAYASGKKAPKLKDPADGTGDVFMQVVPSGPDIRGDALYEAIISAIYTCRERIWIVTPYFVPSSAMMQALRIARHKGLDVKLITPQTSDHLLADLTRSSYMRALLEAGIDVELYEGTMLHAKAILFDDLGTMLGSVNIDNRSLLLNYEIVSFAYSGNIINEIDAWMRQLLERSKPAELPSGRFRSVGENLMRIFAPLL